MKKISFLKKLFLLLCVLFAKTNITGSNYGISQEEINAIEEMMQDPEVLKDMYSQILNSSPQERKEIAKYMGLSDDDMDQFITGIQQEFNAIESMNNNTPRSFESNNSKEKSSEVYTKPTISTATIKEDFTKLINSISNIIKILTNIYQIYNLETRDIIKIFTLMNNYLSIAQHNLPKEIETFPSDFITYYQEKLFPIEQKIKSVTFIKNNIPNIYSEILNIPLNSTIEEINETIQSIIEESKKSTSQIKKSSLSEKEKRKKINSESVTLENIFEKLEIMGYDREKNLISQKSLNRYNEKLRDQFNQEIENKNYIQQFLNEIKENLEELSTNPHKSTLDELLKSSNSQISAKIEEYNKQAQQTLSQIISQKASSSVIDIDPEAQRRGYNSSYQDYNPYGSSYNSSYGNNHDYNDNYNQQEPFNDKNNPSNEKSSQGGGGSSSSGKKPKDESNLNSKIKPSSSRNSNSRYNEPQESTKKNNESEKTEELNSPLITFTENLKQLEILFNNLENTQKFNDKKNILISIDKLNKEIDSTFNEVKEIDFQPNEQTSIEDIINILKSLTSKIESSKTDTDTAITTRITQTTLLNLKKYLTHFDAKLNELKELQTIENVLQKIIANMDDAQKFYLEFDPEKEDHITKLKLLSKDEYNKTTQEISNIVKNNEDFKKYSENTQNKVIAKITKVLEKNKATIEKLSDYYKNIDETKQDSKVSVEKEKIKAATQEKNLSEIIENSNKIIDEIKEPEIQKKVKEELNKIIIENITNPKIQENKSSPEEIIAIIKNPDKASFKTFINAIKKESKESFPILDAYFDLKTLKSIDELKEEKIADEVKKIVTLITTNLKLENKENKNEPFTITLTEILTEFVKITKKNADLEKTTKERQKIENIKTFLRENSASFTLPEKPTGIWNNLKNQFTSNKYKDGAVYLYHMIIATIDNNLDKAQIYLTKITWADYSKDEESYYYKQNKETIRIIISFFINDFLKNYTTDVTKEDVKKYLTDFCNSNSSIKAETEYVHKSSAF